MAYCYVATTQRSTSVTASCVCSLTDSMDRNFVLARGSYIEIYTITSDGLIHLKSLPLYGKITRIAKFRSNTQSKDSIFILTSKLNFCVLSWDSVTKQPIFRITGSLNDRSGKHVEDGHLLFVDPDNRIIGAMVFEGQIKIIPIDNNGFKETFDLRLDLLKPIDIKFLHGCGRPTLCLLFEDDKNQRHMKSYTIELKDRDLTAASWQYLNIDPGAAHIVPVPMPVGGVILIGMTTITYINHWVNALGNVQNNNNNSNNNSSNVNSVSNLKNIKVAPISRTQMTSYEAIDSDGSRYILGDYTGALYVLVLCIENNKVSTIAVNHLGTVNVPETLNYLDNGVVYVGSSFGDSQLVRLNKDTDTNGSYVEVLDKYTNIGPIVDMCVVTGERQGQSQIITCSGAFNSGSLRIIRSGIGIHTQAFIELEGLKGSWAIKPSDTSKYHKFLIQSYTSETRILAIENEEMGEVESTRGFNTNKQSLYCGNMRGNLMVQISSQSVHLLDLNDFSIVYEYIPTRSIIVSHGSMDEVILSLTGGEVIALGLDSNQHQLQHVGKTTYENDIACISIQSYPSYSSMASDTNLMQMDNERSESLVAIGLWTENTVRILTLPTLQEVTRVVLYNETQVRDAMIVKFGNITYLLLGLGDGTLLTYTIDIDSTGFPVASSHRKIVIGTHPISLTGFYNNDSYCVFASCDRPTVIYHSYDKLLFSVVNISEVNDMTPFHSESFPQSLCLLSEQGLTIGTIDSIQKVHIHNIPLNGQPRRIAYHNTHGIYAVIVERIGIFEYGEETRACIVFYDENSMEVLYETPLDTLEVGLSIASIFLLSNQTSDHSKEYIVVGTAYGISDESEPSSGRILVYDIDNMKRISMYCEKEVKAAVYSMCPCAGGKIAACAGSRVMVYSLHAPSNDSDSMSPSSSEPVLSQDAFHQGHIVALKVKSNGEFILVGDLMRSVTLLRYSPQTNQLVEIARDFSANMMLSIAILDDTNEYFLGADDSMNFFTVRRRVYAPTAEEQSKLELHGEYHIGDHVNVIRNGSIGNQEVTSPTTVTVSMNMTMNMTTSVTTTVNSNTNINTNTNAGQSSIDGLKEITMNPTTGLPISTSSFVFGTVSGAIGTIIPLNEETYKFYSALERSVKSVIGSLGGLSHSDWRSFHNERRSSPHKNFVDGDLVETFLDISRDNQEVIVRQLNDELNSTATSIPIASTNTGGNTSLSAMTAMLNAQETILTVEEVSRKVEDIARMH